MEKVFAILEQPEMELAEQWTTVKQHQPLLACYCSSSTAARRVTAVNLSVTREWRVTLKCQDPGKFPISPHCPFLTASTVVLKFGHLFVLTFRGVFDINSENKHIITE